MQNNYRYRKGRRTRHNQIKQKIPKTAGYVILLLALAGTALIPYIFRPQYASSIGIANSSAPNGFPESSIGSLTNEPIFKAVIRNGGAIILVREIEGRHMLIHNAVGLWDPNIGAIKLKEGNYSYEAYLNTLKHEAIHMAQSCGNFGINAEALPLGLQVTQQGIQDLLDYKESNPEYFTSQVEREAYSYDNSNQQTIARLLDQYCSSNPWDSLMSKLSHPVQLWLYKQARN